MTDLERFAVSNVERAAARAKATRLLRDALALCDQHDIGVAAAPHIDLALTKLVAEQSAIATSR